MLDNEPTVGDTTTADTTSSVTTAKPARRRSASRPAGPPPEPDEIPPAPAIQASVATAIGSGVSTTDPAPPAAASASNGASTEAAPAAPEAAEKPKRTRRRTRSADDEAATGETPAAPAEAEVSESRPARKRTTRSRAAKEAAAPETAGQAAEAPSAVGQVSEVVVESAAPEVTAAVEAAQAEVAPDAETATPVRRSRTRKKTEETPEAVSEEDEKPTRRRRTRKRDEEGATERSSALNAAEAQVAAAMMFTLPTEEPLDDEPAGEDLEDLDEGAKPSRLADPFGFHAAEQQPQQYTFQRPAAVFQPLFQAPDAAAAVPARPQQPAPQPPAQPQPEPEPVAAEEAEEESDDEGDDESGDGSRRRRRRRGGRGRGRVRDENGEAQESEEEPQAAAEESDEDADDEGSEGGSRRRRRRRRRGGEDDAVVSDDPPNTVVRIRAPRAGRTTTSSVDEVQGFRGSTRLEAKKQRRREGRELGRRRPPIITESEFLARRESVERVMVVRRHGGRTQIAVLEDGVLVEHYVDREASQSYVGNVYLGKVQNVLPSMEAAFVDVGKGRNAVLYAGEVNFDTAGLEGQPRRIEAALKSGQSVLVQVTKDPMGHKGARLTSQISLPGRYLVYVPDGSMTGISRKLPDKERTRLKQILRKVMPENAGVIVRTAAEGASEEELARDVARLAAQWESIQKKAKSASPPELLSAEPDMTIRVVRDVFNEDFANLVVSGDEVARTVEEYVDYVAPHLAERVAKWDEDVDVFAAYRVDEQIAKAMERKVWLPSGGSLVIDRTEAMTVVDVNTGKFTGQGGNLEETVTRNNLEAAEEIVRQLRLRDVGGIIVIDFIDMVLESNRDLVLRRLLECLARDRTKHQVAEVTSLGLVQMTRKRVGQGLLEAFSTQCDCCHGRGVIISTEPVDGKPEPRGTQGKMAIEKAVAEKLEKAENGGNAVAAHDSRDTVTDTVDDQPRSRRRSRRSRSAD
ncbi:Rne/Rng family ribonuclease [Herbidospora sp. NEAU-GS84]|uniref:Ribonuclease E n=1 Tax=Herbidospora solisilvae TaxID=2696284 RepID=A0A7C9J0W8_9ACTN|nr:Rne/Rng family ribonuclease [Herbidospora solisilvae]NAS21207.1 Rne/Rng family ribonuclease [Herbidospora solisilvae]